MIRFAYGGGLFDRRALAQDRERPPPSNSAASERAFNIYARPELRSSYDALLDDPFSLTLLPYGGFRSLLAAGDISRDGSAFYASRKLSFHPDQDFKHF